jgi:hypothetical protein
MFNDVKMKELKTKKQDWTEKVEASCKEKTGKKKRVFHRF